MIFSCPSTSSTKQKTLITTDSLQLCNQTLQEMKTAIISRHIERHAFEKELLVKYTEQTEKAENFHENILKIKQVKLDLMKTLLKSKIMC